MYGGARIYKNGNVRIREVKPYDGTVGYILGICREMQLNAVDVQIESSSLGVTRNLMVVQQIWTSHSPPSAPITGKLLRDILTRRALDVEK